MSLWLREPYIHSLLHNKHAEERVKMAFVMVVVVVYGKESRVVITIIEVSNIVVVVIVVVKQGYCFVVVKMLMQ
ncbi:hypothetical protein [Dokdonella sp.]|uniref:hypothetical protein n=1 Tax=Dokdonella sp. TaxID=2291710 RepID=UPI002DD6391B|nr:hypothetical protein [Dokdonella sp.]